MSMYDHYRSPRNNGELPPPAHRVEGFNPMCGDEVILTIEAERGSIKELKFYGQGCSISQSSASIMTVAVKGGSFQEAREYISAFNVMMNIHQQDLGHDQNGKLARIDPDLDLVDLEALKDVVHFPVRIQCAALGWNTLDQALRELESPEA